MMKVNYSRYSALTRWSTAFMALHAAAEGCFIPFLTIYFRQLGLPTAKIGFLLGLRTLVGASFGPFWRHLARKFDKLKFLLSCSIVAAVSFRIAISLIPPVSSEFLLEYCADSNHSINPETQTMSSVGLVDHRDRIRSAMHTDSETAIAMDSLIWSRRFDVSDGTIGSETKRTNGGYSLRDQTNTEMNNPVSSRSLFLVTIAAIIFSETFSSSGIQVVRRSLYHHLDDTDNLGFFPAVVTICSLSYGISAFLISGAVDQIPCIIFDNRSSMVVQFGCSIFFLVLCVVLLLFLPLFQSHSFLHSANRVIKAGHFILSDFHHIFLTLCCFVLGLSLSLAHSFLFWHLQDLGGTEFSMGCFLLVESVSHSIVRFQSHWFMQKSSILGIFGISSFCLSLMYLYLGLIWNPWIALLIAPITGLGSTLFWQSLSDFLEQTAPPGLFYPLLALSESFSSVGAVVGVTTVGLLGSIIKFKIVFIIFGIFIASWGGVTLAVIYFCPKKETVQYSQLFRSEGISEEESDEEDWLEKALEDEEF